MRAAILIVILVKMIISFGGLIDYIEQQQNSRMQLIQEIEQQ